ncbi:MAG: hypothetical protein ACK4NQ_03360, partial [Fimbriimonadaceae bacterium]
ARLVAGEVAMTIAAPKTVPRLTELARFAGCAAKIGQADLHAALAGLPIKADPRVLVGHDTSDDAAVIKLRDDLALVESHRHIIDHPLAVAALLLVGLDQVFGADDQGFAGS